MALLAAGGALGCFSPPALAPCALSCERDTDCPAGLACEGERCGACGDDGAGTPTDLDALFDVDARAPRADAGADASDEECAALGAVAPPGCTVRECGRCFLVCTANVTRKQAVATCTGWDGVLAQPKLEPVRACLASSLSAWGWVDLNQAPGQAPGVGWTWGDGTPFTGGWHDGEPNEEVGVEDCAVIAAGNGLPLDIRCLVAQGQAVCER